MRVLTISPVAADLRTLISSRSCFAGEYTSYVGAPWAISDLTLCFAESIMAVGTGFGQLFRGIGQVGGVAVSSAVFQSVLDRELRKSIHTPDAEEV